MQKRRVAVTGIGAVTPLGPTMQATWEGVLAKRRVAAPIRRFDATGFPTQFAYEVPCFRLDEGRLPEGAKEIMNLAAAFGVNAALEAIGQARLAEVDPDRIGVCLGVGMFSPEFDWFCRVMVDELYGDATLKNHVKYWPNALSTVVSALARARGGATTVHTACASSGQSLGEAYELVAYGELDAVVTGGADSMINPFHLAGFSLLGALSKRNDDPLTASRPFDKSRDGFVLGEGACMLVFEEMEHAKKRGAKILGELVGYGVTESAYRITDLHPEGHGPMEAMAMALADAGIGAEKVGYVNAHGTSTHLNDQCESLAIRRTFAPESCDVHVSSTKSVTGHMISAAGAIELAMCLKALEHQILPPSANLFEQDEVCGVKLTPTNPSAKAMEFALSNSVGFGGSNTALIARRVS